MICRICNKEFNGYLGLPGHLRHNHPNYSVKKYYDEFLKKDNEGYCKYCGKSTKFRNASYGYNKYCNSKCANLDEEVQQKLKETYIKKYGVDNPNKSEEVIKKREKTCLEKYGVTSFMKTTEFRDIAVKSAHTNEINAKRIQTNKDKYGANYPFQSDEIQQKVKQSCFEHYGVINPFQSNELMQNKGNSHEARSKASQTMKQNGNNSSLEDKIENKFLKLGILYKKQYNKDIRYPFLCDFYLPDTDLFLEVNGFVSHGGHWFDKDNPNDLILLNKWKAKSNNNLYTKFIIGWTISDVKKRETAKNNNLNYVTLWSNEDIDLWFSLNCPIGKDYEKLYSWVPEIKIKNDIKIPNLNSNKQTVIQIAKVFNFDSLFKREIDYWNNNADNKVQIELFKNRLKYINKNPNELTSFDILRGLNVSGKIKSYSHFDNTGLKKFISKYHINSIYDPCAGWGERLITCAALGIKYKGIDINKNVVQGNKEIIKYYNLNNNNYEIYCANSSNENNTINGFDCTFTCPPYWNTEIYTINGAENLSYKDFLNWWKYVIINSNTPIFAYQINQKYKKDMNDVLISLGYIFIEEINLQIKKSHLQKTKSEYESIEIFSKS